MWVSGGASTSPLTYSLVLELGGGKGGKPPNVTSLSWCQGGGLRWGEGGRAQNKPHLLPPSLQRTGCGRGTREL